MQIINRIIRGFFSHLSEIEMVYINFRKCILVKLVTEERENLSREEIHKVLNFVVLQKHQTQIDWRMSSNLQRTFNSITT